MYKTMIYFTDQQEQLLKDIKYYLNININEYIRNLIDKDKDIKKMIKEAKNS